MNSTECRSKHGESHDAHMEINGECPWCGTSLYNNDPFPADQIPEGWALNSESGVRYIEKGVLGPSGCIASYAEDGGSYFIPGLSEDFQGPYATLAEAVAEAERQSALNLAAADGEA